MTFGNEAAFYLKYAVYKGRGGLADGLRGHEGPFCTWDAPADSHCRRLAMYARSSWWFDQRLKLKDMPFRSDLNSVMHGTVKKQTVHWIGAPDISFTQIKFRPSKFRRDNCDKSCPNGGTCLGAADGTFHCRCAPGHRGWRCEMIDAWYAGYVPPCGPVDCDDISRCWGLHPSMQKVFAPNPLTLRCDSKADGGGWAILQQRRRKSVDFYRTCAEYKRGFGTADTFWLGLDNLYRLTKNHESQLRVEVTYGRDYTTHYVEHDGVTFGNEAASYALNYSVYNGRGRLKDGFLLNAGRFCCKDSPDDRCSRMAKFLHTSWWFNKTRHVSSDLNALLVDPTPPTRVYWTYASHIHFTQIKFRPSRSGLGNCDKSCPNGGTCLGAAGGTFHCRCAPGYTGSKCDVVVTPPVSLVIKPKGDRWVRLERTCR